MVREGLMGFSINIVQWQDELETRYLHRLVRKLDEVRAAFDWKGEIEFNSEEDFEKFYILVGGMCLLDIERKFGPRVRKQFFIGRKAIKNTTPWKEAPVPPELETYKADMTNPNMDIVLNAINHVRMNPTYAKAWYEADKENERIRELEIYPQEAKLLYKLITSDSLTITMHPQTGEDVPCKIDERGNVLIEDENGTWVEYSTLEIR